MNLYLLFSNLGFLLSLCFFLFLPSLFFFFNSDWGFITILLSLDMSSWIYIFILLSVIIFVFNYSSFYMFHELYYFYYFFMLGMFCLSMIFLILSFSIFIFILSWDILGISSFFLVLFYNNWDSCSGSMNTVLTNRLGDFFIFLSFSILPFFSGSFILMYFSFFIFFFFLVSSFTKSAQYPFMGWLPKAMSAPTPISALVHSSTLVTAGLIFLYNFHLFLLFSWYNVIMFFVGLLTMALASFLAIMEKDLKKVVAFSTLSQVGFCFLTLSLGFSFLSFFHMCSHALFKSCLFMQVGFMIYIYFGQQDIRGMLGSSSFNLLFYFMLLICIYNLCGVFFVGGLLSKDFILEFFFFSSVGFFIIIFFFFVVFLTFFYSYTIWSSIFLVSDFLVYYSLSSVYYYFSIILVLTSITFSWWLLSNIFFFPLIFLFFDFYLPLMFFLFFFFFVGFSFLVGVVYNKFLSELFSKIFIYNILNLIYFDVMFNSLLLGMVDFMFFFRMYSFIFFNFYYFNFSIVTMIFFLLL